MMATTPQGQVVSKGRLQRSTASVEKQGECSEMSAIEDML